MSGGAGADRLLGLAGDDHLSGGEGDEMLDGGAGADTMDGGAGHDTVTYLNSNAGVTVSLTGGAASGGHAQGDVLSGVEDIIGSTHGDTLVGDIQANGLNGGAGDDELFGHEGADILQGGAGDDALNGGYDADSLSGGSGNDTLNGGAADDYLAGGAGDDVILAGQGDDTLIGGQGTDVLIGGQGTDTLSGGAAHDRFVFRGASGSDTITDFKAGAGSEDVISLDASIFASFADVKAHAANDGQGNVVISKGGVTITLQGVIKGQLHADDFAFETGAEPPVSAVADGRDQLVLPPAESAPDFNDPGLMTFDGRDPQGGQIQHHDWII